MIKAPWYDDFVQVPNIFVWSLSLDVATVSPLGVLLSKGLNFRYKTMMGQNQRGSSTSTSRLSASAEPFTMKHPKPRSKVSAFDPSFDDLRPTSSSLSALEPFSLLSLGEDSLTVSAYDHHLPVPFDNPQEVGPEPHHPLCRFEGFQDHSDFVDNQGSFCWMEKNRDGLMPGVTLPKQANDVYQSRVSYRRPIGSSTLHGSSSEGSFSDIDSYSVKTAVPHPEGKKLVFGSSGTNLTSFVSNEPLSASKMSKSVPLVTSNLTDNLSLKHQGAEVCDPVENSSSLFDTDDDDLDLDSPCWKGNLNSLRSPFGVSQPVSPNLGENGVEAPNSLNPMAPHFFPCYGKSSLCQTSFIDNGISDDISESNPDNELLNISNFGSVLNSSHVARPYFVEDHFASKGKVASEVAVASPLKGSNKVASHVSTLVSFSAAKCEPSSSLSGVELPTNISKPFQDIPNSLYRSSGTDGHVLVNAMSDLSELLVQNFSNDLDELDHDAVQRIIDNLYVCIQNRDGQRTLSPESTRPEISYCLEKSTDIRQAMKNALKDDPLKEEMHPQTMLYRNLWLEAEAAMKYKARLLSMKTEMEHCRFSKI